MSAGRAGSRAARPSPKSARSRKPSREPVDLGRVLRRIAVYVALILLALNTGAERPVSAGQPSTATPDQPADLAILRGCAPAPPFSRAIASLVEDELAGSSGFYSVAVRNVDTGETYMLNGDRRVPSGSVYKLSVLYSAWREIRLGNLSPEAIVAITPADTLEAEPAGGPKLGATLKVDQALDLMIRISSNAASHAMLRTIGRDSVNEAAVALGMRDTLLPTTTTRTGVTDSKGTEVASTSARDLLCYMTRVARGELLGREPSTRMRSLLFKTGDGDRIPVLLPPNTPVAHKTGEIPGIRNDAGIVYAPQATYVLVVLGQNPDEGQAMAAIARLSRKVYEYFGPD